MAGYVLDKAGLRGADFLFDAQMGQVSVDFRLGHIDWMTHVVEIDKPLNPMAIGLLSPSAVVAGAEGFTEAVQKFGLWGGPERMARVRSDSIRKDWYGFSLRHGLSSSFGDK